MRLSLVVVIVALMAPIKAADPNSVYVRKYTTGCDSSNEGHTYYLTFMTNSPDDPKNVPVQIFVATMAESAQVTIETGNGHTESKTVRRNQVICFQLPREGNVHIGEGQTSRSCVIKVSSDQKIVVYGANREQYTTDAFLALPENVIGTAYYAVTWFPPTNYAKPDYTQLAVAATKEGASVQITLPPLSRNRPEPHDNPCSGPAPCGAPAPRPPPVQQPSPCSGPAPCGAPAPLPPAQPSPCSGPAPCGNQPPVFEPIRPVDPCSGPAGCGNQPRPQPEPVSPCSGPAPCGQPRQPEPVFEPVRPAPPCSGPAPCGQPRQPEPVFEPVRPAPPCSGPAPCGQQPQPEPVFEPVRPASPCTGPAPCGQQPQPQQLALPCSGPAPCGQPGHPIDVPPPGAETIPFPPAGFNRQSAEGFPFGEQRLDDSFNIYSAAHVPPPYPGHGDADGYYVPQPIANRAGAEAVGESVPCEVEHEGRTYRNGETITIQLKPLESFQLQAKCDLTGAYIKSSCPVSVFSGNARTAIGPNAITRDHLVEQIPPIPTWGRTFVTIPTPRRTVGDYYKIIASEEGTQVTIQGQGVPQQQRVLNAGQHWLVDIPCRAYAHIVASKPILVVQFVKSQSVGTEPADPAMSLVMPIEQFGMGYTFNTVEGVATTYQNFMTMAVHKGKEHTLILNGVPVQPAEGWVEIPGTNVTTGYLPIQPGSHTITSQGGDTRFATYIYGAGDRESYAYPTGMCLKQLACPSTPGCCCQRCDRGLGLF